MLRSLTQSHTRSYTHKHTHKMPIAIACNQSNFLLIFYVSLYIWKESIHFTSMWSANKTTTLTEVSSTLSSYSEMFIVRIENAKSLCHSNVQIKESEYIGDKYNRPRCHHMRGVSNFKLKIRCFNYYFLCKSFYYIFSNSCSLLANALHCISVKYTQSPS